VKVILTKFSGIFIEGPPVAIDWGEVHKYLDRFCIRNISNNIVFIIDLMLSCKFCCVYMCVCV